jgi:spore maturation protein CgeB
MIKILKISFNYDFYIQWFHKKVDLNDKSYNDHLNIIFSDRFSWSDSFKNIFRNFSIGEVEEVIANDEFLQKKWLSEFLKKKCDKNWILSILEQQIKFYKPNIIIIDQPNLPEEYFILFKKYNLKIIAYDGIASHNKILIKYPDLIFTPLRSSERFYKDNNKKVFFMPHGFDTRLSFLNNVSKKIEFSFIGNILNPNHQNRVDILYELIKKTPISLWIGDLSKLKLTKKSAVYFSFKNIPKIIKFISMYKKIKKISKLNKGQVFGIEMYKKIATSLVTFNSHISLAGNEAANIRLFEATGLGSCLLTDKKNNINDFFTQDEIVTYDNKYDAADKAKYLLLNPKIAEQIGIKAKLKTSSQHSLEIRWNSFIKYLNSNFF